MKDIESLSLEKYVDELPSGVVEGISRCKTEKDVWSAIEVRDSVARRRYLLDIGTRTDHLRSAPPFPNDVHTSTR